ncbi:hypothetical protein ACFOWE_24560 [Planomonospora corallina]|uniref:Uncharacterized protein n=1 Tax=Planomonospora corallina TaxID=1806052 RepID=A0ABV8II72_9ACTN
MTRARAELTARLHHLVGPLTGRTDVLLDVVWGRGDGAPPAWFDPELAEITVNADIALPVGTDPAAVDPTTVRGRLAHPVLVGLCCHEAGHARAPGWRTPARAERHRGAPRTGEIADWLEELWIEAGQLRHRPADRRWLRAAARHLLKPPALPAEPTDQQLRGAAGLCAVLVLGRVDAGVLSAADTAEADRQVRAVLGGQVVDELCSRWRRALTLAEGDLDGLFTLAEQVRALLRLDDGSGVSGTGCTLGRPAPGGTPASGAGSPSGSGPETGGGNGTPGAAPAHPLLDAVGSTARQVSDAGIGEAAAELADLEAATGPDVRAMATRAQKEAPGCARPNHLARPIRRPGAIRRVRPSRRHGVRSPSRPPYRARGSPAHVPPRPSPSAPTSSRTPPTGPSPTSRPNRSPATSARLPTAASTSSCTPATPPPTPGCGCSSTAVCATAPPGAPPDPSGRPAAAHGRAVPSVPAVLSSPGDIPASVATSDDLRGCGMATVTFRDETATGKPMAEFALPDLPESIPARELVRLRVREEVARYNADPSARFTGLVRPTDAEVELNGYRMGERRRIDWEKQAEAAERAFLRNGFVLLVGDRQIEDLSEVIDLTADPVVSFIKLVPLVGG